MLGDNCPEASMLEEMSSESIPSVDGGEVATGDPGTALNQVVLIIECWDCEVVIYRMALKSNVRVHSSMRPLPDIAHRIIDWSHFMLTHWAW